MFLLLCFGHAFPLPWNTLPFFSTYPRLWVTCPSRSQANPTWNRLSLMLRSPTFRTLLIDDDSTDLRVCGTWHMLPWKAIQTLNISLILPTKLQMSWGKGPCFHSKSHVLRTWSMHLTFAENLVCAQHYIQHKDMMTQFLSWRTSLSSAFIYTITFPLKNTCNSYRRHYYPNFMIGMWRLRRLSGLLW